jgi:uncharacterized protein (TIGR02444 family)
MTMADGAAAPDNSFWQFSNRFYRDPAVAAACITLQDEAGVDVNVLLFLLWSATLGRTLAADAVADLDRRIGGWREAAVVPLRRLRRALKVPPPVVEAAAAEAFRTRIKAAELEAERLQQQTMHDLVPVLRFGAATSAEAARHNVAAYQAISAKPFPQAAVDTLLVALAKQP